MAVLNFPNVPDADPFRCEVPAPAEAVQSLPRVDYADAFAVELPAGADRDPERWARAIFDRRSPKIAALLGVIGLGLAARPAVRDPRRAVGVLNVAGDTNTALCLEMLTWLGLVQIVVLVDAAEPRRLTMSTFITFRGAAGRAAFVNVIGPAHRRVVPVLLRHAVAKLA